MRRSNSVEYSSLSYYVCGTVLIGVADMVLVTVKIMINISATFTASSPVEHWSQTEPALG